MWQVHCPGPPNDFDKAENNGSKDHHKAQDSVGRGIIQADSTTCLQGCRSTVMIIPFQSFSEKVAVSKIVPLVQDPLGAFRLLHQQGHLEDALRPESIETEMEHVGAQAHPLTFHQVDKQNADKGSRGGMNLDKRHVCVLALSINNTKNDPQQMHPHINCRIHVT